MATAAGPATETAAAPSIVVATGAATAAVVPTPVAAAVIATIVAAIITSIVATVVEPSATAVVAAIIPVAPVPAVTAAWLAAAIVPERARAARRRTGVRTDVDLLAADDDPLHRLELIGRQVRRELYDRVVETNRDAADVATTETGLVGERTHDRTGLDVVPLTHGDAVLRHVLARARRAGAIEVACRAQIGRAHV